MLDDEVLPLTIVIICIAIRHQRHLACQRHLEDHPLAIKPPKQPHKLRMTNLGASKVMKDGKSKNCIKHMNLLDEITNIHLHNLVRASPNRSHLFQKRELDWILLHRNTAYTLLSLQHVAHEAPVSTKIHYPPTNRMLKYIVDPPNLPHWDLIQVYMIKRSIDHPAVVTRVGDDFLLELPPLLMPHIDRNRNWIIKLQELCHRNPMASIVQNYLSVPSNE